LASGIGQNQKQAANQLFFIKKSTSNRDSHSSEKSTVFDSQESSWTKDFTGLTDTEPTKVIFT